MNGITAQDSFAAAGLGSEGLSGGSWPPFFSESALFGYKYFKQRTYVVLSDLVVYFAVRGCGSVGLVAGGRTAPDGQFCEQMA